MFDFVLFENFYLAKNHYKDVCIIAEMLKRSGYTVAIADVFNEADQCHVPDVPHIIVDNKCVVPLEEYRSSFKLWQNLVNYYRRFRIAKYLKRVMLQLKGQYRHLYAGSYYTRMSTAWLKEIPSSSSVFFWGLRSSRLIEHLHNHSLKNKIYSRRLRKYVDMHKNVKFFVSDELIREEFMGLGIPPIRLVHRPERLIEKLPERRISHSSNLKLLSIGSIRENKRIEIILDALKDINDEMIYYTIAGKSSDEYNVLILDHMKGIKYVKRLNYRISDQEYEDLFMQCDFLVLCDKKQSSNVTNGTMNEALLKGIPIIAPNYPPYDYFVNQYQVGILFDPEDVNSLKDAILKAKHLGRMNFYEDILKYDEMFLFDSVVELFKKELSEALK